MQFQDEQDYQVLKTLIEAGTELTSFEDISHLLTPVIGGGEWEIVKTLVSKGLMRDGFLTMHSQMRDGFAVTTAGINRYENLKRHKRIDKIKEIAFWILFVASIVSAVYAVISYYSGSSNSLPVSKSETKIEQPKEETSLSLQTDTTKAVLLDTSKSTNHIDTGKHKIQK